MVPKSGHKSLATAANLSNLLPTGTVLAFQAVMPSFTNNGTCELANKYLTFGVIACCSVVCFLSSFTDSFVGKDGKLYYGVATLNGLYVLNDGDGTDGCGQEELEAEAQEMEKKVMEKYKLSPIDFVHAFASLTVFLVFAISSSNVQTCFFPQVGPNESQLVMNLPLAAGLLSSFLFMVFPTRRRGIGCADVESRPPPVPVKEQTITKSASI